MGKKDKKKKDKKGSDAADAIEAVRSAVERTFQATTEGAAGTQKRTRALADEVAHAAARIRQTIEDLKILEDVRGLRAEIDNLARRVSALETRDSKPAASTASTSRSRATKSSTTRARATKAASAAAKSSSGAKSTRSSSSGTRSRSSSSRSSS